MPRFAANLSMMYNEFPFLDRFAASSQDGFKAVEYLFPYDFGAAEIRTRLDDNGLVQALFNAPPGDWAAGERGIASLPGREGEFRRSIDIALDYARTIGNRKLHVMAGLIDAKGDRARHRDVYLGNLAYAAEAARRDDILVVIEPINQRDMPGYFISRQDDAQSVCREVGAPNLRVQFDCYHCQIVEGDVAMKLKRDIAGIGHIQIAGVPERHEPDIGELNYPYLFEVIDALGYDGWVGCEYRPKGNTSAGLGWLRSYWQIASSK
ncbi:hydroxypyruvate isomerase family protein [Paraburkholderia sp. UYCP14C]|uniref:2-oxo-tetronate isomerase n=1 Tax=Paraburkholderia sp. UYCP14C TaxID=2511130 RepID=UPI001021CBBE|nr:2-oxo-tetronate isomerase [Paraburkholderia sp. UYCP14C]RZF29105.1 hydroxypyruvate isomerase family protein [Paraburkholderia sp. UYCP14C]